ncbi:hypothetical protein F2Q69_00047802 [Brassica cretica]|uniref:Uncharacterized protein n=1 Tax=Brassica cretica TaxID=69181 RepID=A0A8S9PGA7_BRACR|nr:hypothetical protein F2Q69_00047802 [Brassica cretica]
MGEVTSVASPILDRIIGTSHGARRRTSQSWGSEPVAGQGREQAQPADDIVELSHSDLGITGADRLAHSAGNSWWPAQLSSVECYGPGRCGRVMGGYGLVGS